MSKKIAKSRPFLVTLYYYIKILSGNASVSVNGTGHLNYGIIEYFCFTFWKTLTAYTMERLNTALWKSIGIRMWTKRLDWTCLAIDILNECTTIGRPLSVLLKIVIVKFGERALERDNLFVTNVHIVNQSIMYWSANVLYGPLEARSK